MRERTVQAFTEFRSALASAFPSLDAELLPPVAFALDVTGLPGSSQLEELWSLTSGQRESPLGVAGGLAVLGPEASQRERERWAPLMTAGQGLEAVSSPGWAHSGSLDAEAVREGYFAAGWIPVLREPLEGNYLAVDLVPLAHGHPGQVILCGRDENPTCVVAPDLAHVFRALAGECRRGAWELKPCAAGESQHSALYLERRGGRLLTACRRREFPPKLLAL